MKWLSSISGLDEYFIIKVVPNLLKSVQTSLYPIKSTGMASSQAIPFIVDA